QLDPSAWHFLSGPHNHTLTARHTYHLKLPQADISSTSPKSDIKHIQQINPTYLINPPLAKRFRAAHTPTFPSDGYLWIIELCHCVYMSMLLYITYIFL